METAKRIIFLLILTVLVISPVQSEEKQSAQISNTRTASCLMKITCDSAILPLNLETIDYLLHSSGVGGKAARDILNISHDQAYDLFTIEYVELDDSGGLGSYGLPPTTSRAGLSGRGEYKSEMSGYDKMMDEMSEYGYDEMMKDMKGGRSRTSTLQPGNNSSTVRSRSSSRGSRTGSGSQPTTSFSSSRRSRDRSRDRGVYDYITTPKAPQQRIGTTIADPTNKQTYLFSLSVSLPDEVEPVAKEFMNAIVENLRQTLTDAYNAYGKEIQNLLQFAESRRDHAQSQLAKAIEQTKAIGPAHAIDQNPVDVAVHERLEQFVDLSNLTASTSFVDVIEILSNSVDPPLQIQPNWKDLLENGEVEQTTPAGMDPLTGIKLRKALEILLDGISGDFAELKYVVDEGVILIATADALPSKMVPVVYEIPALAHSAGGAKDLIDTIQNTIEPESWFEMSDMGEATITPYPSQQPRKLAILQTYENHQEIQKFLKSIKIDIPAGTPLEVPEEMLLSERNNLLREKQNLEMELARFQSRIPAIEEQIKRIKKEIDERIQTDQVSEELRKILAVQEKYFEGVKRLVENGTVSNSELADAEEKLARARIELARRSEQIGVSVGANQLATFSHELATLAIDMAEKKAMLEIVTNQLNQTEQQLTASTILDPQVSQIRLAVRALEIADKRINELNTLSLNVQPPTVSVLGAE